MQLVWAERSYPITGGFVLSVLFHIFLALLIILGIPSFFRPEVLPSEEGIQATIVSDITAAPKVDKAGKPQEQPKPPAPPAPEQKRPEPPKPAPPVAPTAAAPAPAPAEAPVAIPDDTKKQPEPKKPDEKPKPEEKKPEKKPEEKPKPKDTQQQDFNALLKNLTKQQPSPDTQEKPKLKAQAAPAQPTVGPQTANLTEGPAMTASEEDGIRAAIERHWSPPIGMANIESYVVMVRLYMNPDGTVQRMELIDPPSGDPGYLALSESAQRAVEITVQSEGRLPIPQGKNYPTIVLRWDMKEVCADMPGSC